MRKGRKVIETSSWNIGHVPRLVPTRIRLSLCPASEQGRVTSGFLIVAGGGVCYGSVQDRVIMKQYRPDDAAQILF